MGNRIAANSAREIKRRQRRIDFLLTKGVAFPMQVDKTDCIFQVSEGGLNAPAKVIELFDLLGGEGGRQARGYGLIFAVRQLKPDDPQAHGIG